MKIWMLIIAFIWYPLALFIFIIQHIFGLYLISNEALIILCCIGFLAPFIIGIIMDFSGGKGSMGPPGPSDF